MTNPIRAIKRVFRKLARSWAFARIGYNNYDFDSGFLWPLISFKLKRIKKACDEGYGVIEKEYSDALIEAIEICDRLAQEDYCKEEWEAHRIKWGEIEMKFTRLKNEDGTDRNYSSLEMERPRAVTEEEKAAEIADSRALFSLEEKKHQDDLNRFGEIMAKHSRAWWD